MSSYEELLNMICIYWGEARSEILTVGIGGYGGYDIYYYNTLTQANMPISWIRYYQIVNSCNLLLKYAPNVTFNNETSRNKMLAQAYTMRAFMYFVMTRTWGGFDNPYRSY